MPISLPESDWKYLRKVQDELLAELCRRINETAARIAEAGDESEHAKYLKLYRHIEDSNKVVAECFDDWRRSNLMMKVFCLRKHKLLSEEHVKNLSSELRSRLDMLYPTE